VTTVLTLDTPEARRALRQCVRLLLRWADEDEIKGVAPLDPAGPQRQEGDDAPDQEAGTHRGILADEPGSEKDGRT
jgi:hypothetical protein